MKQLILTFLFCTSVILAQAQVRQQGAGQTETKSAVLGQQEKEVSIYPNPNNGVFTISFDQLDAKRVELSILNVIGNEVYREVLSRSDVQSSKTVDLTRLAKGLYYVKIEADGYSSVRRIVVK
jgi:hypothetical protein